MRTLPVEYRERVVALADEGRSSVEIAETLGTSSSWVDSIKRLHQSGQPLQPKSRANKRQSLATREGDRIRARVAEYPGTTLEDLKRDLSLKDSIVNIWYALQTLGLSLKKNDPGQRTRTTRRRRAACRVASRPDGTRPAKARLPRRNLRHDGDEPSLRLGSVPVPSDRRGPAWPLEDDHLRGRLAA